MYVIAQGRAVRITHSIKPDAYVLEASRAKSKEAAISLAATSRLPPFSEMCQDLAFHLDQVWQPSGS